MSTNQKKNRIHACGRFSAATPPLVEAAGTGNWSVVRNGAGDWTLTLQDPIDTTERLVLATSRVTSSQVSAIEAGATDTTVQLLNELDDSTATDSAIDFVVFRIAA